MQMGNVLLKIIRILFFITLAVMLTGCKDAGDKAALTKAAAPIKEEGISVIFPSAEIMYSVEAVNIMETLPDEPEDLQNTRVSTEFISDGKTYTITAVSIGKTHKEGDAVYTVYEICLTDENGDRIQSFYSNMIDDYIDFSFDDLNFDGYPDMQILYFHWKRGNNLRHLYLWDSKTETFSENVIELETDYEISEEKKAFIMKEIDTGGEEIDTLCRINAKGEMERTLLTGKDSNDGE